MTSPVAVVFCMPEEGHFKVLCPLISDLVRRGVGVHVLTHRRFEPDVTRKGAIFSDLFAKYPLERADNESMPIPCRYVSFAGHYAEDVLRDVRALGPSLVVYETFAVIGRVVADLLGIPYINVSPGHNLNPARLLPLLQQDPRAKISPRCDRAVTMLRERYGLRDASPFSYVSTLSPYLNLCCEPEAFLEQDEWKAFEPFAIYGSLPSEDELTANNASTRAPRHFGHFEQSAKRLKVYVSFGTVVWRYYAREALAALKAIAGCLARMPDACAVISLGGAALEAGSRDELSRPNVQLLDYVDQWSLLGEADAFVTHHGVNSTHEAIFHRVPMISYPFVGDQLALADKCRQLGLAIPLADSARSPVTEEHVRGAFAELFRTRESLHARLAQARDWELNVMANRSLVMERIVELVGQHDRGGTP